MTVAALRSRIHHFKEKYKSRLQKRRANIVMLSLGGAITAALLASGLWHAIRSSDDPEAPASASAMAPSTTASNGSTLDPAAPAASASARLQGDPNTERKVVPPGSKPPGHGLRKGAISGR